MRPFALKLAFIGLLILGVIIGVWLGMNSRSTTPAFIAQSLPETSLFPQASPTPQPTATPAPELPAPTSKEWPSPNGKSLLVLKTTPNTPTETLYSFYVKTQADPTEHLVFSKTAEAPTTLFIPFNSWSPDNKHFFLQEKNGNEVKTFVFNSSGEPFADAQPLLDVDSLFAAKNVGFNLKEVTGWAAPTLLIVNSITADNQDGPSYWFDVNRKSVTRLSTSFQ